MKQKEHDLKHERHVDEFDAVWEAISQREDESVKTLKEIEKLRRDFEEFRTEVRNIIIGIVKN